MMPPEPTDAGPLRRRVATAVQPLEAAIEEAVEAWGGRWDRASGELEISIRAGLRVGRWHGKLMLAGDGTATHLRLEFEGADYRVDQAAFALLSLSGLAAIPLLLWPFVPRLLSLLPIALVLAVGGWFLVISRLQNQGPEEFLDTVVLLAVPETPEDR